MKINSLNNNYKQNFGLSYGPTVRGIKSTAHFVAKKLNDEFTLKNINFIENAHKDLRLTAELVGGKHSPEKYVFSLGHIKSNKAQSKPILSVDSKENPVCIINKLANKISNLSK